jgi:hypothetical protein
MLPMEQQDLLTYNVFSSVGSHYIWRTKARCPYHKHATHKCPFGKFCCFRDDPSETLHETDYSRSVPTVEPRRKGNAQSGGGSSNTNKSVLNLTLVRYMEQYGVIAKSTVCRSRHDSKMAQEECGRVNATAHSLKELLAPYADRNVIDYFTYHRSGQDSVSVSVSEFKLVPRNHYCNPIQCALCQCAVLGSLVLKIHTHDVVATTTTSCDSSNSVTTLLSRDGLTDPFIDIHCMLCRFSTKWYLYNKVYV